MICLVTGASSGFGYEVSRLLAEQGHRVYGLSRRAIAPEGVTALPLDITRPDQIAAVIGEIAEREGRIDVLINNAGMGISGPVEFAGQDAVQRIIGVNFTGALTCTQAVLPYMRQQREGHIVFVSSVAAEIAIPYQAMYSATKAALTSLALALRNEVGEFGIRVAVVEPGDARTAFTDSREKESAHDALYTRNHRATASMERDERNGMSAAYVASRIVRTALCDHPKPLVTVGAKYKLFVGLFRLLPARLSYWIVGRMYG